MSEEFYTIVVFPGETGSPKRIRIPRHWFRAVTYSALILVLGIAVSSIYLTQKYFQLADDEVELTELRRDSKIRKIQVEKFAQQVKSRTKRIS